MWLLFGVIAMVTAVLNIVRTIRNREAKWFRFISLSFTAFTLCAILSQIKEYVIAEDWSALMDILPGTVPIFLLLTIASVVINSISLFKKN